MSRFFQVHLYEGHVHRVRHLVIAEVHKPLRNGAIIVRGQSAKGWQIVLHRTLGRCPAFDPQLPRLILESLTFRIHSHSPKEWTPTK